ncbi:MAG: archaeosortase/exosortase family protein [Opitutae bacterium]|nr:archaeosortase/exosortase family protein [Opitutae bacterium]MDG1300331.1 archaeosortase/exosortase family protein [Opitutae bacterium]
MSKRQQILASFQEKRMQSEFWINCTLYGCLGIAFLPITLWVAATTNEQSRILHALIVLAMAILVLVFYNGMKVEKPLTLNKSARHALFTAYGLLLLSVVSRKIIPSSAEILFLISSLLAIPAYCFGLASMMLFIFGQGVRRITYTATGTFCAFIFLSILMAPLDWPLRTLAGKWSGIALSALGKTVELGVQGSTATTPPQLILIVNQQPFHVASECNGFGVILTSLLLSVLLAIYRRLGPIDTALNLLSGITLGFVFNTLRILIIVLLAPSTMDHYHLMHEIVGTITYWSCLILTWILLNGPVDNEPRDKPLDPMDAHS